MLRSNSQQQVQSCTVQNWNIFLSFSSYCFVLITRSKNIEIVDIWSWGSYYNVDDIKPSVYNFDGGWGKKSFAASIRSKCQLIIDYLSPYFKVKSAVYGHAGGDTVTVTHKTLK